MITPEIEMHLARGAIFALGNCWSDCLQQKIFCRTVYTVASSMCCSDGKYVVIPFYFTAGAKARVRKQG